MSKAASVLFAGTGGLSQAVAAEIPGLYRYALTLVGDSLSAEWLVSDTISKAWEKSNTLKSQAGLRAWLHRILHNLAVDAARRTAREVSVSEVEDQWRDDTFSVDPEVVAEMAEDREELMDALFRLPFAYRSAVLLHDMEGWKLAEVAESLEISLSAAKQRLRRGRMMLVSALSESATRKASNVRAPLTCWEARSMVSDYLDGELSGTDMERRLVEHLSACTTCPPLYASLVGVKGSLSGMRDPDTVIPAEVLKRIHQAAERKVNFEDVGPRED